MSSTLADSRLAGLFFLLETLPGGLLLLDMDGHCFYANSEACALLGVTSETLLGHELALQFPLQERLAVAAQITSTLAGDSGGWSSIVPIAGGEERAVELTLRRSTLDGKPLIAVTLCDTTEERRLALTRVEEHRSAFEATTAGSVCHGSDEVLREQEAQYRDVFEATSDAMIIANLDGFPVEVNPEACRMYGYSRDEFLDLHPRVLSPQNLEVVRAGGTLQEQAVNHRKDGTSIHVEGRAKAFTYRGKPHILTVVRDITERVHAYEVLEQRVEERTRELSTLLDVSRHVTSTLELQPLLDLILEQVRTVADYSGAAIFELRDDRVLTLARRSPGPDPHAGPDHYPANEVRPLLDVLLRGEPIIIEDVRGDTPMAAAYRVSVGEYLETDLDFERSWMGIPMSLKDRIMGVLALSSVETGFFTLHHAELALAIAQQAAVAIENARLYERAQELAALEERQRLARELHDSVSQALFGIGLGARTARALVDRDPGQAAQSIDYVLSLAQGGMAEMRALIFELRPESLETEGLIAALQKQAEATSARYEIPVRSSLCAEPAAPLPVKEALYRIAQEALHNTVKHAQAGSIELSLVREERDVVLEVRDDGRGFDPGGSFPGHLGLHSMKERAARHGGVVGVESALGRGTSVRARIPLAVES